MEKIFLESAQKDFLGFWKPCFSKSFLAVNFFFLVIFEHPYLHIPGSPNYAIQHWRSSTVEAVS
jgi:hypothetical protein